MSRANAADKRSSMPQAHPDRRRFRGCASAPKETRAVAKKLPSPFFWLPASTQRLRDRRRYFQPCSAHVETHCPLSVASRSPTTYCLVRIGEVYPNTDFYSGITLKAMGFPMSMFTALFAVARTGGKEYASKSSERGYGGLSRQRLRRTIMWQPSRVYRNRPTRERMP
jgi:hypothetical protein